MIETFDTAFRLIAVGSSLLLLVLLLAGEVRRAIKIPLAGLLVGAIAYLFTSAPVFREVFPWLTYIDLASLAVPFWLWLFARRLFEREPSNGITWGLFCVILAGWFAGEFIPQSRPAGFYIIHFLGIGLVADLIRVALAGRDDDLIEKRRVIRLWLPILVGLQTGGVLIVEVILADAITIPWVQLVNAGLILALSLFSGLALLKADTELLAEAESVEPSSPGTSALSPSELVLKERLHEAMASRFYRTPGLSIAGLAHHLEVPEHRLRALINKGLGHRNFSAFLNGHRITEARAILADKAQVDVPVLTIAMDLGYNSLATFNRAFKAETGTTPTDYRRETLGVSNDQN